MAEKIIIEISEDGHPRVIVEGHAGPGCKALSADIERALGTVKSDTKTREYHQTARQVTKVGNKA